MCPREELDAIRAQWLDQDGTSYYGMCSLGHFLEVVVKTIKEYLVKQHPDGSHALSEATAGPPTRIVIDIRRAVRAGVSADAIVTARTRLAFWLKPSAAVRGE